PNNAFVAGFIGSPAMNLVSAPLTGNGAQFGNIVVPLHDDVIDAAKKANLSTVTLGIRPESFTVAPPGTGLQIKANLVEELGADAFVYADLPGHEIEKQLTVRFEGRVPPRIGDTLSVEVRQGEDHVFHPETGERLGRLHDEEQAAAMQRVTGATHAASD
ncbi:MAG TPA: TOBE domain-containing protein, partial [Jatrophihabitantaceae bacterium]|nr:TOBE domain-containing protein [Jatrophihabitantaceae bacterium]